jgi:hypothetical protein
MRTMKTIKVHEWLVTNNLITPAKALRQDIGLEGDLEYRVIEQFLDMYFEHTAPKIFREMQCEVTTTLHFEQV